MSLERELERLDRRIAGIREDIEIAYATRVPDERKDALFARLDTLLRWRDLLRQRYVQAVRWQVFVVSVNAALGRLAKAFADFANKPEIRRLIADLSALEGEPKRSQPAFWRGVAARGSRVDVASRAAFSIALPANRRPVLPGIRRQKGKG